MSYVKVSQKDIDDIEKARLALYAMFPDATIPELVKLQEITNPMYNIAHRKYEEAED